MTEHNDPATIGDALMHTSELTGKAPGELTWADLERVVATATSEADQEQARARDAAAELDRRQEGDDA